MASYRLEAKIIRRSKGHSSVAAAAYRAGAKLKDDRTNITHDYSKRGGVAYTEIMLPDGAPEHLKARETLWNVAEGMETRKDGQPAREVLISLPHELTDEQRVELVREFVKDQFISERMAADIAIHRPQLEKGDSPKNYHAHVLLTMRQVTRHGLRTTKTREWNSKDLLKHWRKEWATIQNAHLEKYGHKDRVHAGTLKEQKEEAERNGDKQKAAYFDREPEIHVGAKARQLSRQGKQPKSYDKIMAVYSSNRNQSTSRVREYTKTDRGSRVDWNQSIIKNNTRRYQAHVKKWAAQRLYFQRYNRHYTRMKHKPHARKRLSLLEKLIRDIMRASGYASLFDRRLSFRLSDYQARYFLNFGQGSQKQIRGQNQILSGL